MLRWGTPEAGHWVLGCPGHQPRLGRGLVLIADLGVVLWRKHPQARQAPRGWGAAQVAGAPQGWLSSGPHGGPPGPLLNRGWAVAPGIVLFWFLSLGVLGFGGAAARRPRGFLFELHSASD